MQQNDSARYQRFMQLEAFTQQFIANGGNIEGAGRIIDPNGVITIPVVFHVLHRNEPVGVGRNISDAQIQSQIDVINEDFKRLNADMVNTPNAFVRIAGTPNFQFKLACSDPNGNPTDGIKRVFTPITNFTFSTAGGYPNETGMGIKYTSLGGDNAWATNRYLNIWTCDFNDLTLGYGTYPSDYLARPNVDGVVLAYDATGRVGTLRPFYDKGRTATHEIGHWLNLRHLWGDTRCGTDFVPDTPIQETSNSGCPNFPRNTMDCNTTANGEMFMNYMDYTFDACMNLFTTGQVLRERAVFSLGGPRASFINNYFNISNNNNCNTIVNSTIVAVNNPLCLPITWAIPAGGGNGTINPINGTNTAELTITSGTSITVSATGGNYTDTKTYISANFVIAGPNQFCGSGTYSVQNLPSGATVTWQALNTTATITNAGVATATNPGGSFIMQATITYNCNGSNSIVAITRTVIAAYENPDPLSRVTTINGSSTFCGTSTYNISNLPSGATIIWTSSNTGIATVSNDGTATTVATKVAAGTFNVIANISLTNCINTFTKTLTKTVTTFNLPNPEIVDDGVIPNPICVNDIFGAKVTPTLGATYTWSVSKFSNLSIVSGANTPNVVLKAIGYGIGTVFLAVQTNCGTLTTSRDYRVGNLFAHGTQISSQTISPCITPIRQYNLTPTSSLPPTTIYRWKITDPASDVIINYTGLPIIHTYQTNSITANVEVYAETPCGNTQVLTYVEQLSIPCLTISIDSKEEINYLKIQPNPSNGVFTVKLNSNAKDENIKEVVVKNKMGVPIYHQKFNFAQKNQSISLLKISTDIYTIEVFDGTKWVTQKLSLKQ